MNTTSPDTAGAYRPHTLDEYPELTPEEVGRRFLKLIDSLKSFDELSPERVRGVTQLPMTSSPETHSEFFWVHLPESGWHYSLTYSDNPQAPHLKGVSYEFTNRKDDRADMGPVCALDFKAYVTALKQMGFKEDVPTYDELGRLIDLFYTRGNVRVIVHERREADEPDEKLHHPCVEHIGISRIGD